MPHDRPITHAHATTSFSSFASYPPTASYRSSPPLPSFFLPSLRPSFPLCRSSRPAVLCHLPSPSAYRSPPLRLLVCRCQSVPCSLRGVRCLGMSDSSSVSSSGSAPSCPRRWQCFLGCGQRYMKSSGRSIRRHVLLCYRRQFAAECKGVSDAQIHDLLVSQEEKGTIHTGLKRWRLRRSRRLAMDLPPHERWDCPNQCGRYFRSTSSRSIAKHKVSCRHVLRTEHELLLLPVHSSDSLAPSPNPHSSLASVMSPTTTSSSSSSFSSSSSISSSSSLPQSGQSQQQQQHGTASDVADSPLSTSQSHPSVSLPRVPSGQPSESPIERINTALRLSEPMTPAASTVIRPVPRLHASLPLLPASSPLLSLLPPTDKQIPPPRIKQLPGDGMSSSLLIHPPSTSAFRPVYTNTSSFPSPSSLSPTLFNLSPLHALASVRQGYVLCSFPAQQLQVPVIQWPY